MRTLPHSLDSVWEGGNIWARGSDLCGLIWWALSGLTDISKPSTIISKSLHRVEELSNHNDLTINLTFKIPSEQVCSTLIYFISQTIRSVLKLWLTRSNFWCLMLAMSHGPMWKQWVKVIPSWSQREDCFQWNWYCTQQTKLTPFGSYLCLKVCESFMMPITSLCKMYLASYYDVFMTLIGILK